MLLLKRLKSDLTGYVVLAILVGLIIGTHLLSLCVFFLFIYLFTDVFTNDIHRRFPVLPLWLLLVTFYLMIITVAVFISIKVMPAFFKDITGYYALLDHDIARFSSTYGVTIDLPSLKEKLLELSSNSIGNIVKIFNGVSKGLIYIIFTLALNLLLFLESNRIKTVLTNQPNSLLTFLFYFILLRIKRFYRYFRKVMGGQVIISLINTSITCIVVIILGLPHKISLVSIVFLCGLFPVVGNIVSNTILSITALVSSGVVAFIFCLCLLVGIHKLEYFLNGKIIGSIIRLPMFLTLLALLLGEATLGIWGMIIAIPFVLTLKEELENIDIITQRKPE